MTTVDTRKVVLHNDDKSPLPFVLQALSNTFKLPGGKCIEIAVETHKGGAAVIGEYPAEEAASLSAALNAHAVQSGWPLNSTVEAADWSAGEAEAKAAGAPHPAIDSAADLVSLIADIEEATGEPVSFAQPGDKPGLGQLLMSIGMSVQADGAETLNIEIDTNDGEPKQEKAGE